MLTTNPINIEGILKIHYLSRNPNIINGIKENIMNTTGKHGLTCVLGKYQHLQY